MSYRETLIRSILMCFCLGFSAFSFGSNQASNQNSGALQATQQTAAGWVELGNQLLLNRQPEQAIDAFRKAIDLDPEFENAYLDLSSLLGKSGRGEEQIALLYSALKFIPASTAILQKLMTELFQAGRDSDAVDIGQKYLALKPRDASALGGMGDAYFRLKQYKNAMDSYENAIEIDEKLFDIWRRLGSVYLILNRNEDALTALQRVLDLAPQGALRNEAWTAKVILLMQLGRKGESAEEIDRELGENPDNAYALSLRSMLKYEQNKPEEAIADLKQSIELTSNPRLHSMQYGLLGIFQSTLHRYPEAIESLKKSIELGPDNPASHAVLATAYFYSSSYEEAINSLGKAINSKAFDFTPFSGTFNMMAFNNLALCLIKLERWQDAEKALRYSIQLDRIGLNPHMNLARVFMVQQKFREAESELLTCVRQGIADWKTYSFLGDLYIAQKRISESVPMFRQALKLQPENPMLMNNLGYSLLELDMNLAEAMDLIKRAVKAAPLITSFHDSLGWAYFKSGKMVEAERELLQAVKGNPKSAAVMEHLGDLYRKMGRKADALSYWKLALTVAKDEETKTRLQAKITGM